MHDIRRQKFFKYTPLQLHKEWLKKKKKNFAMVSVKKYVFTGVVIMF